MARDLDSLVGLQRALTEDRITREQLAGVPESMREIHEEHQGRLQIIQDLQQVIEDADHSRRESEAAAQDVSVRLKRFREQVNQVSTQREYGALLSEIDEAQTELSTHEDVALAAIGSADEAEEQIEEQRSDFEELDTQYQEQLAEWEAQKPDVERRLKAVEAEIAQLREDIPRALMVRFERLFDRLEGQALAMISKVDTMSKKPASWHCSHCNYRVRPQVVVNIKNNGNLNQCESCQRFLYWQEESE